MHVPGVEVVGTLPPEIEEVTVFSGAVCVASAQPAWRECAAILLRLARDRPDQAALRHGADVNAAIFEEPKIDCHVHVFDPARFPYRADTHYAPDRARRSVHRHC